MYYQRLHQTLERITSKRFISEAELLSSVINELVNLRSAHIVGGRIWKLNPKKEGYEIYYQTGDIDKIPKNYVIYTKKYPVMDRFLRERTILSDETDTKLRETGILKYSASGVGDRIKLNIKPYYEYIIAFNSPILSTEFKYELNIIATVLTSKIKHWRASSNEKDLFDKIDKARQLQKSILPEHEYFFHDYEIYGLTIPSEYVGGDFFDYLEIGTEGDRVGVTLGDAASKGVAAAAEAMYISGALRMAMNFEIKITPLMRKLNKLVNKIFKDDKFSSMFYCELSTDSNGLCLYANAGHNPPMFLKKKSKVTELLNPTGPVLGVAPKAYYSTENIDFEKGDILLIFSDGLCDSTNEKEEDFGEERVKKLFISNRHLSPKEIALTIMGEVIKFSSTGTYSDDKTIVIIRKN
ncbi:MAG: PP2C family protein-serine/threonine phosphatase [Ignavibacteriaceae bacterium]